MPSGDAAKATVRLRSQHPGGEAEGVGFFGAPGFEGVILTNTFALGMPTPDSERPSRVEILMGDDSTPVPATVLDVDLTSALAVLKADSVAKMPTPVRIHSTPLDQGTRLYFPGIPAPHPSNKLTHQFSTITSVSSPFLRVRKTEDASGSGGPAIAEKGHVVGVALLHAPAKHHDLVISGNWVHDVLHGSISSFGIENLFQSQNEILVPARVEIKDPLHNINQVLLDLWDSNGNQTSYILPKKDGVLHRDVPLPNLQPGNIYKVRPRLIRANGDTHWGTTISLLADSPLQRPDVTLPPRKDATDQRIEISLDQHVWEKAANSTGRQLVRWRNASVSGAESVQSQKSRTSLLLRYHGASLHVNNSGAQNKQMQNKQQLAGLVSDIELDARGNLRTNTIHERDKLRESGRESELLTLHETLKPALGLAMLGLPKDKLKALQQWTAHRPIEFLKPDGTTHHAEVILTFTYQGTRQQLGSEVAFLKLEGAIRDPILKGSGQGRATVEVASGIVRSIELSVEALLPWVDLIQDGRTWRMPVVTRLEMKAERPK